MWTYWKCLKSIIDSTTQVWGNCLRLFCFIWSTPKERHYLQQEARNRREEMIAASMPGGAGRSVSATCSVKFDKDLERGLFQFVQVRLLSFNRIQGTPWFVEVSVPWMFFDFFTSSLSLSGQFSSVQQFDRLNRNAANFRGNQLGIFISSFSCAILRIIFF
jgi:hypothetical protein